jgi:hypothetical protein
MEQVQGRTSEHLRLHDAVPQQQEVSHHLWREQYDHGGGEDLDERMYSGISNI